MLILYKNKKGLKLSNNVCASKIIAAKNMHWLRCRLRQCFPLWLISIKINCYIAKAKSVFKKRKFNKSNPISAFYSLIIEFMHECFECCWFNTAELMLTACTSLSWLMFEFVMIHIIICCFDISPCNQWSKHWMICNVAERQVSSLRSWTLL